MEGAAARAGAAVVREVGRRAAKQALEVSEAAAQRIAELLSQREKEFIKLSVKTRGCSGLSYSMSYAGACCFFTPCQQPLLRATQGSRGGPCFSHRRERETRRAGHCARRRQNPGGQQGAHARRRHAHGLRERQAQARASCPGVPTLVSVHSLLATDSPRASRSEFVFSNPNSKGSCGCGESFTT